MRKDAFNRMEGYFHVRDCEIYFLFPFRRCIGLVRRQHTAHIEIRKAPSDATVCESFDRCLYYYTA